jgi:uncharacterized protein (DUF488 family)
MRPARIVTVGHSTRPSSAFVDLLRRNGVQLVADIRKLRASRAFPWFAERPLRVALRAAGIDYLAIPELAGRRPKAANPQPRPCWRNAGFRNYADHMRSEEFRLGTKKLLAAARGRTVALLCAEAIPWRCHRGLVADWLVVEKKRRVDDLVGARREPHRLTACARIAGGRLTYQLPARRSP